VGQKGQQYSRFVQKISLFAGFAGSQNETTGGESDAIAAPKKLS
jgi:hypothetical protein